MEKHAPPESAPIATAADRLDSWKEIAAYLKRDVTTAQRWERREAMPVHRHRHDKLGSVYAFCSELDAWRRNRQSPAHNESIPACGSRSRTERSARKLEVHSLVGRRNLRRWVSRIAALVSVFAAGFLVHGLSGTVTGRPGPSLAGQPVAEKQDLSGSSPKVDPAARHEYQVGRYYLWRYDEEHLKRAIHHFERATAIDPSYAAAFAALSNAWWARGMFGPVGLRAAEWPARRAAQAALTLDDRLAAAYVAQGDVKRLFDKDPPAAERMMRRALTLDPNSVEAHHSAALLLMALGRLPEALAEIERAAMLDPLAPAVQSNFGRILYRAGRFEDALSRLERALELEPGMRGHYSRVGDVYDQLGQYERALEAYDRSGDQGPVHKAHVARVLARMGRSHEAKLLLESLANHRDELPLSAAAAAYAALGETNEASRLLARVLERDDPGLPYFPVDPQFVSLHTVPQWPALVRRTGVSAAQRW